MSFRTTISWLIFPLTMWYAVGVAVRNFLYAVGLLKQEAPHVTTIGVGNLATGGTGKTPHVEYLLRLLSGKYRTAMLSRGYKRQSKGYVLDDGSHDPLLLGDEPALVAAKHPEVQVAVCNDRLEGVHRLIAPVPVVTDEADADEEQEAPSPIQLIVLDDVYQHRRIKPSINILLTEYQHPFFRDHILPYGNLREFRSDRDRASIVIVTTEKDAVRLKGKTEGLPVYVLPIEVAFHKDKDIDFDQVIESIVRENISFLSKLNIWNR